MAPFYVLLVMFFLCLVQILMNALKEVMIVHINVPTWLVATSVPVTQDSLGQEIPVMVRDFIMNCIKSACKIHRCLLNLKASSIW